MTKYGAAAARMTVALSASGSSGFLPGSGSRAVEASGAVRAGAVDEDADWPPAAAGDVELGAAVQEGAAAVGLGEDEDDDEEGTGGRASSFSGRWGSARLRGSAAVPAPRNPYTSGRLVDAGTECVDPDQLAAFVFPPGRLHPRSTGRLILFSLYGPLTSDGRLVGGRGSQRALSERELSAMIDDVERQDVCAVYTGGSVLCDVAGVETDVRAPSLKLPNISRAQLDAMLVDLPRDAAGNIAFPDVQARVEAARAARIADMKRMFPAITASDRDPAVLRTKFVPPSALGMTASGRDAVARRMAATALAGKLMATAASVGGATTSADMRAATSFASTAINLATTGLLSGAAKRAAPPAGDGTQRTSFSGFGKPARPRSLGPIESYKRREACMHRGATTVIELADLHSHAAAAGVAATLTIVRGEPRGAGASAGGVAGVSRPPFSSVAPLSLHPRAPSMVPGGVYVGAGGRGL
jgi:hypothetical protein